MKGYLQTVSGLALAIGLLTLGWQMAGRPSADCAMVGSGFQAVGAAVELWAVFLIVWTPWARPRAIKVVLPLKRWLDVLWRKAWQWRHGGATESKTVPVGMAVETNAAGSVRVSGGGSVHATGGSLESLVRQAHQRLRELERRVEGVERMTADKVDTLRIEAQRESQEASKATEERFADLEMQTIRVRTNDALRLLLGIGLSLIGAIWSMLC
jgi:hypothetical protein